MIPIEKVKNIIEKHSKLEADISSTNLDKKKFAEMSKEYSDINEIIDDAKFYTLFDLEKTDLEKIINDKSSDKEMIDLANKELSELITKNEKVKRLIIFYYQKMKQIEKCNFRNKSWNRGLEASLFAADLFKMYEKICNNKNGL